jgi:hypothetical protein
MFRGGDDHVAMLVDPARRHGDNIEIFLVEHLAIIGIRTLRTSFLNGLRAASGMFIGHGDNFYLRDVLPNDVDTVPIVALPGSPDDSNAILGGHTVLLITRGESCARTSGKIDPG